jgi:hypothetical protein
MGSWGRWLFVAALAVVTPLGTALAQVAPRSAQSDCTREVERRGYRVVSAGNFQQFKDGWQLDVRARDHAGRNVNGSCFVETRSGDVTLFGFGWGGSTPADRYEFTCASPDHRYRECQLPVDGRARLVKQKSDAPCVEGRSWGQRGDRVWVDNGCRGKFEVARGGGGGTGQQVDCRSQNNRYQECAIRKGYEARIVRDYTGRCREDSTWGTRPGVLWVTNGCQGRFQIVPAGGFGGSGGSGSANGFEGQQQRAESHCRNEARRQGVDVRHVSKATVQGSYWTATVTGQLRGQNVQATCRYYPSGNRTELRF